MVGVAAVVVVSAAMAAGDAWLGLLWLARLPASRQCGSRRFRVAVVAAVVGVAAANS